MFFFDDVYCFDNGVRLIFISDKRHSPCDDRLFFQAIPIMQECRGYIIPETGRN